jgi:cell wall-associated NlpC family hydrolase
MIEQSHRPLASSSSADLDALQRRASRQRYRRRHSARTLEARWQSASTLLGTPRQVVSRLPARLVLHAIVTAVLPLAVVLGQLQPGLLLPPAATVTSPEAQGDFTVPMAPLNLDAAPLEGDAPLDESEDLPVPLSLVSRSAALAPVMVPATIAAERVYLRNGPGTEYDAVGRMSMDAELQVIGRRGDWFQVRERIDSPVYWVSGELLNIPDEAVYNLFEVADSAIPAPPPPKVATVREDGLLLRDGPGTNYVPMAKLNASTQLELLEIYQDWYHVGIPGGSEGWVKGDFLAVEPGIVERLLVAETIPDPNPAMVGLIADNSVNLRRGPDSRYGKVTQINAGVQVDVIGKNKDWFQIRLSDGTKAWVFSDLLNVTAHVARRVPVSKDFKPLPVAATRSSRPGAGAGLANIAASGDVASYAVQFVGYRYRWGGASPKSGFDCSGLMTYVYRQFGVSLPRTAAAQYNTSYGVQVGPMENLAPGDLMFFRNTGGRKGISHVAMYIGGGRMVHAMTPRYGVQVSSVWGDYWTKRYYGAIRVRR